MKTKDLIIVGAIYALTIQVGVNIASEIRIKDLKKEVVETKKVAIQLDERLTSFEDMVLSLNNELDEKEDEIQEYYYLESLKKDLR